MEFSVEKNSEHPFIKGYFLTGIDAQHLTGGIATATLIYSTEENS
jgi:hypothetical protein